MFPKLGLVQDRSTFNLQNYVHLLAQNGCHFKVLGYTFYPGLATICEPNCFLVILHILHIYVLQI